MRSAFTGTLVAALLAGPATSWSQDANDPVFDSLKAMITAEVLAECTLGSSLTEAEGTFSVTPKGNMIVRMAGFECDWEFSNHFFCGARACVTREYEVSGSDLRLVEEYLE